MVNMAVAVELLPVTGQTLPLISSGGSSIWMTCFALGIIISVTKKEEEIAQEMKDAAKREEALQKLIDRELEEDGAVAEGYSIEDKAKNPMHAVLNK
jgi:cell division protein FtsW